MVKSYNCPTIHPSENRGRTYNAIGQGTRRPGTVNPRRKNNVLPASSRQIGAVLTTRAVQGVGRLFCLQDAGSTPSQRHEM